MDALTPLNTDNSLDALAPPLTLATPPRPTDGRLVTPEILFLNQGTTYRMGAAFGGTANPSVVWQQMIDNMPIAMLYYRELEAKDDDIGDAIDEMKLSVLKRKFTVTPGDDSAIALEAADFVRAQFESIKGWRNALYNILDSQFYGYTVAELMFDSSMGQASLLDIADCPQELFCFAPYNYPQIGQLRLKNYASSVDGAPVPESKFLVSTRRSRHGNRMGMPILREIYWASWFKRNLMRFWLRLAEKGPGTAVVTYKEGAGPDEKAKALMAADALINEVAIAVPETFSVVKELLDGTRPQNAEVYDKLYNVLESKIYRRIVGSTLTSHGSDGGKGTNALGKVHAETKEERSVELAIHLADVLNRGAVRQLVLWNFGPQCPMPTAGFDVSDEADMGERITTADTLQQMGLDIPKKWAYGFFGIPMPQDGEEMLARPAAPPSAIITPAGSPDKPQFSDKQQEQVEHDARLLDTVFAELRRDALDTTGKHIRAVVEGVKHSGAGPRV